jgi:hypothetical protein
MLDDSIASLRTLFSASLLTLVVWLAAWPATSEKLSLFAATVELHEWVDLKDRLARLERDVFETPANEPILSDLETEQRIAPNEETYEVPVDLVVDSTWPERRKWKFRLEPADFDRASLADLARAYRVTGRDIPRSWQRAYALFLKIDADAEAESEEDEEEPSSGVEIGLVATHDPSFDVPRPGARQIRAALRNANQPARWEELRLALLEQGFDGDAGALTREDAALARLRSHVDVRKERGGVSVLGMELHLGQFFAVIGVVLAVQAFLALGPLLALREAEVPRATQTWIFLLPVARRPGRRLLEALILAVTIAWAAAPLGILALQIVSYLRLGSPPHALFWPGGLGLIASALVFAFVTHTLRSLRVAQALRE